MVNPISVVPVSGTAPAKRNGARRTQQHLRVDIQHVFLCLGENQGAADGIRDVIVQPGRVINAISTSAPTGPALERAELLDQAEIIEEPRLAAVQERQTISV